MSGSLGAKEVLLQELFGVLRVVGDVLLRKVYMTLVKAPELQKTEREGCSSKAKEAPDSVANERRRNQAEEVRHSSKEALCTKERKKEKYDSRVPKPQTTE